MESSAPPPPALSLFSRLSARVGWAPPEDEGAEARSGYEHALRAVDHLDALEGGGGERVEDILLSQLEQGQEREREKEREKEREREGERESGGERKSGGRSLRSRAPLTEALTDALAATLSLAVKETLWCLALVTPFALVVASQGPVVIDPSLAPPPPAPPSNQTSPWLLDVVWIFADDLAGRQKDEAEIHMLAELMLLLLRPLYALALARLAGHVLQGFFGALQRFLPGLLLIVLHSLFKYGWPLAGMLFPAVCFIVHFGMHIDSTAWRRLYSLPLFLPVSLWLCGASASLVLLDIAVKLWQNRLTINHFEERAHEAYEQQRALRRIVAAVRAAERDQLHPVSRDEEDRPLLGGTFAMLQDRLEKLTGPLDFGSDMAEAATVAQARRRASRLFKVILAQPELRVLPDFAAAVGQPAPEMVDRDKLVEWAYRGAHEEPPPKIAEELFSYGQRVDADSFIKVVERTYQEQRLITASVASFDRLHMVLLRGLQVIWAFVIFTAFAMLWGINIVAWLLPLGSALLVFSTLAGGLTHDFISGFFFAYVTRPYDVGDRVALANPGAPSQMMSLIVQDIYLLRTLFLTSNGESMMLSNSVIKNMQLTNYARSGKITLLVQLTVPIATSSAKVTELLDAISDFVREKPTDWSNVNLMFTDAVLDKGHLILNIWLTSVYQAHEFSSIYAAKSRFLRFCHAYMQAASIEYTPPVQPFRQLPVTGANDEMERPDLGPLIFTG